MEAIRVTSVLLLFVFSTVFSFPSRPLNERSTELAWQAWLLVDDQNQNRQNDPDGVLRRRITPKSIFIAPTFSPETLPACAEGYRSDSMGRCINIIQIDADAHLNFLLQKLNEKFGKPSEFDDEDDSQESGNPTSGPFQLNIPLDMGDDGGDDSKEAPEDNVDVAIVVAPTNGNFDIENDSVKVNVKRTNNNNNRTTDSSTKTVEKSDTTMKDDFFEAETGGTTEEGVTTTITTTGMSETTETTTVVADETTQQALFYWEPLVTPSKTEHVPNGTNNTEGGTPLKRDSADNTNKPPITTTTAMLDDDFFTTTLKTSPVRFPVQIKFPDAPVRPQTTTYASKYHHTQGGRPAENHGHVAFGPLGDGVHTNRNPPGHRAPVNNRDDLAHDPLLHFGDDPQYVSTNNDRPTAVRNHRNRDKHSSLWIRPSSSLQKQLLLQIPRTIAYQRYEHAGDRYHRQFQPDEVSYIFGARHKRTPRR